MARWFSYTTSVDATTPGAILEPGPGEVRSGRAVGLSAPAQDLLGDAAGVVELVAGGRRVRSLEVAELEPEGRGPAREPAPRGRTSRLGPKHDAGIGTVVAGSVGQAGAAAHDVAVAQVVVARVRHPSKVKRVDLSPSNGTSLTVESSWTDLLSLAPEASTNKPESQEECREEPSRNSR
jgi:hypothetical protein